MAGKVDSTFPFDIAESAGYRVRATLPEFPLGKMAAMRQCNIRMTQCNIVGSGMPEMAVPCGRDTGYLR
jgi:hypothetical protein